MLYLLPVLALKEENVASAPESSNRVNDIGMGKEVTQVWLVMAAKQRYAMVENSGARHCHHDQVETSQLEYVSGVFGILPSTYSNMSFPIQTAASQWLLKYESASEGWHSALNSEAYCSSITQTKSKSQKQANCEGSFTRSIDVLCSISVITVGCDVCTGFGTKTDAAPYGY